MFCLLLLGINLDSSRSARERHRIRFAVYHRANIVTVTCRSLSASYGRCVYVDSTCVIARIVDLIAYVIAHFHRPNSGAMNRLFT